MEHIVVIAFDRRRLRPFPRAAGGRTLRTATAASTSLLRPPVCLLTLQSFWRLPFVG